MEASPLSTVPLQPDHLPSPSSSSLDTQSGKRQRSNSETFGNKSSKRIRSFTTDNTAWTEMALNTTPHGHRDPNYYFEDGSCIFLVESTLFKVHRTRLCNDSSSFGTMFSLPQEDSNVEGQSDNNPIVLVGDTDSEFRNFLWAFYALPPEISKASENLPQLIDIARVSNKYAFKSLEMWALNTIHEYVNRKPSPILAAVPAPQLYTFSSIDSEAQPTGVTSAIQSTEQLTKLIKLAQMCNHEPLLATMIDYLKQLMSSSLQYAYLAMTLADELDIRTLRGVAYLEVMQKAVVVKRTKTDFALKSIMKGPSAAVSPGSPEGETDEEARLVINRAQQLRLLSGYYRLTGTWERLRATPPVFEHANSCGATWHQQGCTQSWVEFWKEKTRTDAVIAQGLADVVGRLKQLHKEYERWGSAPYMHHDCRSPAKKCILEIIEKVESGLPDFFSDGSGDM